MLYFATFVTGISQVHTFSAYVVMMVLKEHFNVIVSYNVFKMLGIFGVLNVLGPIILPLIIIPFLNLSRRNLHFYITDLIRKK